MKYLTLFLLFLTKTKLLLILLTVGGPIKNVSVELLNLFFVRKIVFELFDVFLFCLGWEHNPLGKLGLLVFEV